MKRILILGASEFQKAFVNKAKSLGYYVGIVDIDANAPACANADIVFQSSIKDKDKVLEIAKEFKPDAITVGIVDSAVCTCAYVTKELNLPGLDMDTALRATDKHKMIQAFKEHKVPHPEFRYLSRDDKKPDLEGMDYPLIVKPVDMSASRGIFLANNQEELYKAIEESSDISESGELLVEEYLDGPEVSVEIVVKDGQPQVIQITDKSTSGAPHFAEIGHVQPSQLSDEAKEQIAGVAIGAAKALGLKNCLGHAEIKLTSKGAKMIEIGARAGGDAIAEQLIELSTGVSFPEIALQIALGQEIIIPEDRRGKSSCIRFILSEDGILESITGVEDARAIPGVKELLISGIIGQKYSHMVDNHGRLGYVITAADTAAEAKAACDKAIAAIKVTYR